MDKWRRKCDCRYIYNGLMQCLSNVHLYVIGLRHHPANTKHFYNICTTSAQRLRRWSNIVQMPYNCFVFTGKSNGRREDNRAAWWHEFRAGGRPGGEGAVLVTAARGGGQTPSHERLAGPPVTSLTYGSLHHDLIKANRHSIAARGFHWDLVSSARLQTAPIQPTCRLLRAKKRQRHKKRGPPLFCAAAVSVPAEVRVR